MSDEKPKRGRPKGANSFVLVRMSDLQDYLGPQGVVKVSKLWLKEIGLSLIDTAVATIQAVEEQKEDDAPIEFTIQNFEDEDDFPVDTPNPFR